MRSVWPIIHRVLTLNYCTVSHLAVNHRGLRCAVLCDCNHQTRRYNHIMEMFTFMKIQEAGWVLEMV
jgi:hypothetical protein